MTTKRHFKKRTLLKKHKKVNLTKKHIKKRLTKTRINKLVGGAPYTDDDIRNFANEKLLYLITEDDYLQAKLLLEEYLMKNIKNTGALLTKAKDNLRMVIELYKQFKTKQSGNTKAYIEDYIRDFSSNTLGYLYSEDEYKEAKTILENYILENANNPKTNLKYLKQAKDNLVMLTTRYQKMILAKEKNAEELGMMLMKKSSSVPKKPSKLSNKELASFFFNNPKPEPEEPIQISHMWFKKWPDHGVPEKMDDFQAFISRVFDDMNTLGGNTVIHCSAGVGRTGVVYVVLKLLSEGDAHNNPRPGDIKERIDNIINEERKNRNQHFVQADIQYNFIYKYFTGRDMPEYAEEFNKLSKTGCETDLPKAAIMVNKNRYSNIIPCESKRVMLKGDNTYINASNMSSLTVNGREIKIIAAQCPKDDATIKDFYQMVKDEDNNIKRIIMVTGLSEKGAKKCEDYFGSGLELFDPIPNSVGMVVSSKEVYGDILETRILTNQKSSATQHIPSNSKKKYNTTPPVPSRSSKSLELIENATQKLLKFINSMIIEYASEMPNVEIVLSFCDCKIILLYILAFDLLPTQTDDIIEAIKQQPVSGNASGPSVDNNRLINFTFIKIKELMNRINLDSYNLRVNTCRNNSKSLKDYLKTKNYKILFGENLTIDDIFHIFDNIETIIGYEGIYIKNTINDQRLLNNIGELQDIFDASKSNA